MTNSQGGVSPWQLCGGSGGETGLKSPKIETEKVRGVGVIYACSKCYNIT